MFQIFNSIFSLFSHVMLPKDLARLVPKSHLMTESEWRAIGVQQSRGWVCFFLFVWILLVLRWFILIGSIFAETISANELKFFSFYRFTTWSTNPSRTSCSSNGKKSKNPWYDLMRSVLNILFCFSSRLETSQKQQ